jgi:DNA-binding NarL/FixJ family response regulator
MLATDLRRLGQAVEVLSRPLEFPSIDAWRLESLERTRALFGGDMAHLSLKGFGVSQERVAIGYAPGVFEEYVSQWVGNDPTYELMARLSLTSYTRRQRHAIAGPLWYARYQRSAVYNEFYRRYQLLDGAGIYLQGNGRTAHLHLEPFGEGSSHFGSLGEELLRVLEPAFRSAIAMASADGLRDGWLVDALLASESHPIAVFTTGARLLHASAGWHRLLERLRSACGFEALDAVHRIVRRRGQCGAAAVLPPDVGAPVDERIRLPTGGELRISATAVQRDAVSSASVVIVRLHSRGSGDAPPVDSFDRSAIRQSFDLTERQLDVAILIARGLKAREIATALGVRYSTATRHTEAVFRALGVRTRAAAALLLARYSMGGKTP